MSALEIYFKEIFEVIQSTRKGMALTWKHAWDARKQRTVHQIQDADYFDQSDGILTVQYPHTQIPTPVNGRYQLHNEMDDCIVCDKCVKVCPVDCIDIEPIKATGLVGHTSDGSPIRLYAAKFDIDMSKCCFCGLCTTVCPTECLTMTSEYDFSVFEVKEHNFSFANLSPEEADEKRKLYDQFVAEKAAMKEVASQASPAGSPEEISPKSEVSVSKPAFKPSFKKVASPASPAGSPEEISPKSEGSASVSPKSEVSVSKPAFKPSFKKVASPASPTGSPEEISPKSEGSASKPAFKPSFKKVAGPASPAGSAEEISPKSEGSASKPAFKPSFKKVAGPASPAGSTEEISPKSEGSASASPKSEDSASNDQSPMSNV